VTPWALRLVSCDLHMTGVPASFTCPCTFDLHLHLASHDALPSRGVDAINYKCDSRVSATLTRPLTTLLNTTNHQTEHGAHKGCQTLSNPADQKESQAYCNNKKPEQTSNTGNLAAARSRP
jgi:hypothetical protein